MPRVPSAGKIEPLLSWRGAKRRGHPQIPTSSTCLSVDRLSRLRLPRDDKAEKVSNHKSPLLNERKIKIQIAALRDPFITFTATHE